MNGFDINGLSVTANGTYTGVFWTASNGDRHHVWLEVERVAGSTYDSPNNGFVPVKPYRVKGEYRLRQNDYGGKPILYRNCPLNPDGEHKGPRDAGYFDTRKLDASNKANTPMVAEALRRAEAEGLFEAAVEQATRERIAKEADELRLRAASIRKDLWGRREQAEGNARLQKLIDLVATLDDADIVRLASL